MFKSYISHILLFFENLILEKQAYSSVVERTAHNGLVAGSNPAKLNYIKFMKLSFKKYKILKIKNYIKTNNLFIFFNGIHQNSTNWIKTEQGLKSRHLSYYKIFNKTSKIIFKKSIYKNTKSLINGLTFFIKPEIRSSISKKLLLNLDPCTITFRLLFQKRLLSCFMHFPVELQAQLARVQKVAESSRILLTRT